MGGPLKRTKLRSSPEEAALYRRFHDPGLAALHRGVSRVQLLQELADQGVSLISAERIVTALEQEAALGGGLQPRSGTASNTSLVLIIVVLIWGGMTALVAGYMIRGMKFHWGYLVSAGVVALSATLRLVFRGPKIRI